MKAELYKLLRKKCKTLLIASVRKIEHFHGIDLQSWDLYDDKMYPWDIRLYDGTCEISEVFSCIWKCTLLLFPKTSTHMRELLGRLILF